MQSDDHIQQLMRSSAFQALTLRRTRMSFILSGIMLLVFFCYFVALGYFPDWMASRLFQGSTITIGIWFTVFCVVFSIAISGFYTWWANTRFDKARETLLQTLSDNAE